MYYSTKYTHKKLKPGLVAFYDIRPGNRVGLFSKERISRQEAQLSLRDHATRACQLKSG